MNTSTDTIVVMVSVGNRTHITDYTFPRLSVWASKHNYSCVLLKKKVIRDDLVPHFNKLLAHTAFPGFDQYIIVDDDLLMKSSAPGMEPVPRGFVGLSKDAIQTNTPAEHVAWTGNTGFIVADKDALPLLEEACANGEYPFTLWDGSNKGIWGAPYDQAALLDVVFRKERIYELAQQWNYQAVIDFYTSGNGWHTWRTNRLYRLWYYFSLLLPFTRARKLLKQSYSIHMTMGIYPRFFKYITD